jgi:tryptophanyl-tRNA synthetase
MPARSAGTKKTDAMAEATRSPRVFSGIQPSGNLTLGNYLGALRRWVEMQDEGIETLYCVVDLHAITVWQEPAKLRQATREVAAAFLAIGLDPARSILFNQSQVPAHAELAWIFNCVARLGWLNRMTQFKEKAGKDREASSVGLYAYPTLMAADILAYHGTHVPVGEDQKQHVELARDIAAKFNHDFGVDFFPLPEPVIEGAATRVMSLRDGAKKMSKSDPSDMSRINLTDGADAIAQKIRRARTDPDPLPEALAGLDGRAEARNLVNIYAALAGTTPGAVVAEFAGRPFSAFKPALADLAVAHLSPITGRMNALMADPAEIDRILGDGARRAAALAEPILEQTHDIVGLLRSR